MLGEINGGLSRALCRGLGGVISPLGSALVCTGVALEVGGALVGVVRDGNPLDLVAESVDRSSVLVGKAKWGRRPKNIQSLQGQLMGKAHRCPALHGRELHAVLWFGGGDAGGRAEHYYEKRDTHTVKIDAGFSIG